MRFSNPLWALVPLAFFGVCLGLTIATESMMKFLWPEWDKIAFKTRILIEAPIFLIELSILIFLFISFVQRLRKRGK